MASADERRPLLGGPSGGASGTGSGNLHAGLRQRALERGEQLGGTLGLTGRLSEGLRLYATHARAIKEQEEPKTKRSNWWNKSKSKAKRKRPQDTGFSNSGDDVTDRDADEEDELVPEQPVGDDLAQYDEQAQTDLKEVAELVERLYQGHISPEDFSREAVKRDLEFIHLLDAALHRAEQNQQEMEKLFPKTRRHDQHEAMVVQADRRCWRWWCRWLLLGGVLIVVITTVIVVCVLRPWEKRA